MPLDMPSTCTYFISLEKLNHDEHRAFIVRLAMATNDLLSCDRFRKFAKSKAQHKDSDERAAIDGDFRYIIRMQAGHLHEGLELIKEIKESTELKTILMQCLDRSKDAFKRLERCLKRGSDDDRFDKQVSRIRHNAAFHYSEKNSGKVIRHAMKNRLEKSLRESHLSFTVPTDLRIELFRYTFADEIFDTMLDSDIFKVNPTESEVLKALEFQTDLANEFVVLGVDYIHQFMKQRGLLKF
jgi:hypothetical protein